jgi:signal peptide peptidase SppA
MKERLLHSILFSPWMMDGRSARAYHPIIVNMLKGHQVDLNEEPARRPFAYSASSQRKIKYYNFGEAPEGSVAVHTLIGAVTKYGGWCTSGTEGMMMSMSKADEMKNIAAHMLEIDSGGGEATNIETVARFIRNNIKKPVVAWFNGTCASAAYYIASACDEIYASEPTDQVGSIGVLLSFMDFKPFYESQGVNVHEIYATQSELKNADYKAAREGDYEPIRERLLDAYADTFITTVAEFRPNLKEEDAYKGKIYKAPEAINNGMIDGMKTFEQAVDRCLELSDNQKNDTDMSFNRIESVLGYDLETKDGGVYLRAEELQQLNRAIVAEGYEAVEAGTVEGLQTQVEELRADVDATKAAIEALQTAIESKASAEDLQAQVDAFEAFKKEPGAAITTAFTPQDPQASVAKEDWEKAEDDLINAAESGAPIRFTR